MSRGQAQGLSDANVLTFYSILRRDGVKNSFAAQILPEFFHRQDVHELVSKLAQELGYQGVKAAESPLGSMWRSTDLQERGSASFPTGTGSESAVRA